MTRSHSSEILLTQNGRFQVSRIAGSDFVYPTPKPKVPHVACELVCNNFSSTPVSVSAVLSREQQNAKSDAVNFYFEKETEGHNNVYIRCHTLHYTMLYYTILYYTMLHYNVTIILFYTMLCYTIVYYTTLHYTALHCTSLY